MRVSRSLYRLDVKSLHERNRSVIEKGSDAHCTVTVHLVKYRTFVPRFLLFPTFKIKSINEKKPCFISGSGFKWACGTGSGLRIRIPKVKIDPPKVKSEDISPEVEITKKKNP